MGRFAELQEESLPLEALVGANFGTTTELSFDMAKLSGSLITLGFEEDADGVGPNEIRRVLGLRGGGASISIS
jgi:hypothetical protein